MHAFFQSVLAYIHGDGLTILPEMELLLFSLGILIFDFLLEPKEKYWNAILALLGVSASGMGLYMQLGQFNLNRASAMRVPGLLGFHDSIYIDGFSIVFAGIFLSATALAMLLSVRYLQIERETDGEYYSLLLLSCVGMMLMASGIDLIVLFLGLA